MLLQTYEELDLKSRNVKNIEYIYQKSEELVKAIKIDNKNITWNLAKQKFDYNYVLYDFDNLILEITNKFVEPSFLKV